MLLASVSVSSPSSPLSPSKAAAVPGASSGCKKGPNEYHFPAKGASPGDPLGDHETLRDGVPWGPRGIPSRQEGGPPPWQGLLLLLLLLARSSCSSPKGSVGEGDGLPCSSVQGLRGASSGGPPSPSVSSSQVGPLVFRGPPSASSVWQLQGQGASPFFRVCCSSSSSGSGGPPEGPRGPKPSSHCSSSPRRMLRWGPP